MTVTLLDGLVCARSVFSHSMNYRSAVIFGTARLVTEDEEQLRRRCGPSPSTWCRAAGPRRRAPTRKELAATSVLALPLDEASVKVRTGPPDGRAGGPRARTSGPGCSRSR